MVEIQANSKTCKTIRHYLDLYDPNALVTVTEQKASSDVVVVHDGERRVFIHPFRFGALLDYLALCEGCSRSHAVIQFKGGSSLDQAHGIFKTSTGKEIALTEKESHILVYLFAQKLPVSKGYLLREIWQYADGIETHTLETHIYRLRQKIESNPSIPSVLCTVEGGYRVL